jgi:hypothetical protein
MMGYYSGHKKNKILPSATTWMGLEDITLREISRHRKDEVSGGLVCHGGEGIGEQSAHIVVTRKQSHLLQ